MFHHNTHSSLTSMGDLSVARGRSRLGPPVLDVKLPDGGTAAMQSARVVMGVWIAWLPSRIREIELGIMLSLSRETDSTFLPRVEFEGDNGRDGVDVWPALAMEDLIAMRGCPAWWVIAANTGCYPHLNASRMNPAAVPVARQHVEARRAKYTEHLDNVTRVCAVDEGLAGHKACEVSCIVASRDSRLVLCVVLNRSPYVSKLAVQ
ncbi:hypothetical protein V8D89_015844 [Ganoderma adspersum]